MLNPFDFTTLASPQPPTASPLSLLNKSTILGENYVPLLAEALLESLFSRRLGCPQNGGRSKAFGLFPTA
jgi:hypothetical protein